ncbi:MAG: hypothetical protein JXB32_13960 [Deltaproteobacteria bacterium]|nr:hypothetical protein [Deltaproteobacteria bacterium]
MTITRGLLPLACLLAAACSGSGGGTEDDGGSEDGWPDEFVAPDDGADAGDDRGDSFDGLDADGTLPDFREVPGADADADTDGDGDLPEAMPLPPTCGDGTVDPGEECDDGNRLNGDGCNWVCRRSDEPFPYPPPDPDTPPVEPTDPPAVVTGESELSAFIAVGGPGFACHPLWLAAAGDRFAVAYNYDQPYYGVRLRLLDRAGRTVGTPWEHETPWGLFAHALFRTAEGFGLLSGSHTYGLQRSRFSSAGAPLEEFLLLRPARVIPDPWFDPWDGLTGGTWSAGRWLAVSSLYGTDFYGWLLETYSADGRPLDRDVIALLNSGLCVESAPAGTGFAVGAGQHVVVLDAGLNVLSWSGSVPGDGSWGGVLGLSADADGYWLAWSVYREGPTYPGLRDLWIVKLDLTGEPCFPPRPIVESAPRAIGDGGTGPGTIVPELALADGPAGAAVVYWQGLGDGETAGGPVMLVTVDDWGNVITPPTPVLGDGEVTTIGWVLAVAADDLGYGTVTMTQGAVLGTASLVFRHFAAAP